MFLFHFCLVHFLLLPTHSLKVLHNTLSTTDPSPTGLATPRNAPPNVQVKDVTICLRFNLKRLSRYFEDVSRLLYIGDSSERADGQPNYSLIWLDAVHPYTFFGFGDGRANHSKNSYLLKEPVTGKYKIFIPKQWTHLCVSYDQKSSYIRIVKDGSALNVDFHDPFLANIRIDPDFLQKISLGGCPGAKVGCTNPGGRITDLNVWDRVLPLEELEDWTKCRSTTKGSILNWDTTDWDLINIEEESDWNYSSLCAPGRQNLVLFPQDRNFETALALCHRFKAQVPSVSTPEAQREMMQMMMEETGLQNNFWTGWTDDEEEGTFVDTSSGDTIVVMRPDARFDQFKEVSTTTYYPWYSGEPNGERIENCVEVTPTSSMTFARDWGGVWNDNTCSTRRWSFCNFDKGFPHFNIRGLCLGSRFDSSFTWDDTHQVTPLSYSNQTRHSFNGFTDTILYFNGTFWKLELLSDPVNVFGVMWHDGHSGVDYPFGTHEWTLNGDVCEDHNKEKVLLNFNACSQKEFNCADGTCVLIDNLCDGSIDCPDRTDELNCTTVKFHESYMSNTPGVYVRSSRRTDNYNFSRDAAVEVEVSIIIFSVLDVDEVDSKFSVQYVMTTTWKDPRLSFQNLKLGLNVLSKDEVDQLWTPSIIFSNTANKDSSFADDRSVTSIIRNENQTGQANPSSELYNTHYFDGSKHAIKLSRVYAHDFICQYDMMRYPFDEQSCEMVFAVRMGTKGNIKLRAEGLDLQAHRDLIQYFIKEASIYELQPGINGKSRIAVEVVLGRRLLNQFLTSYLPNILICLVSFSTNYYRPSHFEAIVTVNLTSLLVMTTLFISISDSLPKTSYIKMIDVWLLANLCVPFVETLLHTVLDRIRQECQQEEEQEGCTRCRSRLTTTTSSARSIKVRPRSTKDENEDADSSLGVRIQCRGRRRVLLGRLAAFLKLGVPSAYAAFALVYFAVGFALRHDSRV